MVRRLVPPIAALLLVIVWTSIGAHDVISRAQKARPAELDMSPMGRIAAGYDPVPEPAPFPDAPLSRFGTALSGGDVDRLTHSPVAPDFQSETSIAKNGDWVVVGFNDVRGFSLAPVRVSGYAYSHDGGLTWTDGGQLPAAGGDAVFGDPDVKTWRDENGTPLDPDDDTVYFVYSSIYIEPFSGLQTMCVHVSTDGGVTWSLPRENTIATIPGAAADKEFIDIDPETGRLFMSWTNFGPTRQIKVAYSDNMGLTWTHSGTFNQPSGQGSVPRCAANGNNVHLVWSTGSTITYTRSFNNGGIWTGPVAIASGLSVPMNPYGSDRISNLPAMDVDPTSGNVYVTYASRNLPPDFGDVYFLRSIDGGVTFSAPVAINSSPGSDRCQFFPAIAADEFDQTVTAMWYDQRAGTGTSDLTEVVHTHSTDGGVTWTCPASITDQPFHAEAGNTTSQPNIGDYNQCVSENGTVYSVFGKTGLLSWLTFSPDTYVDISAGTGVGPAPLAFDSYSVVDAGCVPNNGAIEPGELVELTVTLRNTGGCSVAIGSVVATLTTTTPGITITDPTAAFPAMWDIGSTSTNSTPFRFTVDPGVPCGTRIELSLNYGVNGYTSGSLPFVGWIFVGRPVATVVLAEYFDGVVPPALPAGWSSTTLAGTFNPWRTSLAFAASGANSVFCADIATTSHNELQSPAIVIPAGTEYVRVELDETHNNELDTERRAWDGGVMRLLVNGTRYFSGGAGNMYPFYPWQMNRSSAAENPLHDLACWSGDTTPDFTHYATDFLDLGGQTIRVVLGMSTDSAIGTATGQFVDNIEVTAVNFECDCGPPTAAGPAPMAFDRVTVVPNPFNPETSVRFALPSRTPVTAEVWSVSGALVRTLAHEQEFGPGPVEVRWDGTDNRGGAVASGIYFVRVKTALGEHVARAVLLK
jgi:hypothetical protein